MLGWIARAIMIVAGVIAGWFVARDDTNFDLIQMSIALLLITACVAIAAFWPSFVAFFKGGRKEP